MERSTLKSAFSTIVYKMLQDLLNVWYYYVQSLGTEFEKAFALKLKWAKNIQNSFYGTYVYKLWLQYFIMSLVLQNRRKPKESNVFLSGW